MATLESAFNSQYSENAAILTGDPDRITVEVEYSIDADFWRDLLCEKYPQKHFHFSPYYTNLKDNGKKQKVGGKSRIIKSSETFNQWHIGCVDSDYDWLLSNYTDEGKLITDNKYLLQTYAYSFENLVCLSSTLSEFCQTMTEETTNFDFIDYITKLSRTIYPLLIWSVYLYSKGKNEFLLSSWRSIMVNTHKDVEASLAKIVENIKVKVEELDKNLAAEINEKNKMKTKLAEEKNVTPDNAYLFVRGHDLYDHLYNSVIGPIIKHLCKQHYKRLRESDMDENSRKIALQAFQEKEKKILLARNYLYKGETIIYDRISQDIFMIWK